MSAAALVRKLDHAATYADLEALPPGMKGEIIDGELYVQPRPRAVHARAATTIASELQGPYDFGRNGPGGWWILGQPGIGLPGSPSSRLTWRAGDESGFPNSPATNRFASSLIGSARCIHRRHAATIS